MVSEKAAHCSAVASWAGLASSSINQKGSPHHCVEDLKGLTKLLNGDVAYVGTRVLYCYGQ